MDSNFKALFGYIKTNGIEQNRMQRNEVEWNGAEQLFHFIVWIFYDWAEQVIHSIVWQLNGTEWVINYLFHFYPSIKNIIQV